jgi:hypothetical protein
MPIYFGDLESSLKATMIFPREPDKAIALAGWLITRDISKALDKAHDRVICDGLADDDARMQMLNVSRAAAYFAFFYSEAQQNLADGRRAGVVVANLWALICEDGDAANWERAIEAAENNFRLEPKLPASRPLFRDCLSRFKPVLHLLAARTILGRSGPDIETVVKFTSLQSAGYSRGIDVQVFADQARALGVVLLHWDQGRPHRSQLLGEMFDMNGPWVPPARHSSWPRLKELRPLAVDPHLKPEIRRAGRPPKIKEN